MSAPWPIPPDAKSITVNGYPYAYREAGGGVSVVLIHGSIGDYRVWTTQLAAFSKRHRVITPSLRHYYPEPWSGEARPGEDSKFSIEQHASDVAALIKALDLGRVHLLGWSRGGAVVNEVAKRAPEVIRTLILEDGTIDMLAMESPAMREAQTEFMAEFTKRFDALKAAIRQGDLEGGARTFYDISGGPGTWDRLPRSRRQSALDNLRTALAEAGRPATTSAEVAAYDFPILALRGERSPARYELTYAAMRRALLAAGRPPFAPTVVIPKAGHAMHLDNPAAFNAAVEAWLAAN